MFSFQSDSLLRSRKLQQRITEARQIAPTASRWQHKHGGRYIVLGHTIDSDTGLVRVRYERYDGPGFHAPAEAGIEFVRPISEWTLDRFIRAD